MITNHRIRTVTPRILFSVAATAGLLSTACGDPTASVITRQPTQRAASPVFVPTPNEEAGMSVVEVLPATAGEWVQLARQRIEAGDHRGAIDASDSALALEPARADALHQKGRALWALDRGHEALVTLETARRADPANGQIANTTGYLLLNRGQPEEALPHLEAARDALPQVAYVRNNLGVAYERAGRLEAAVEEYRAAVAAGDSGGKATASLARLHRGTTAPLPLPPAAGDDGDDGVSVLAAVEDDPNEK